MATLATTALHPWHSEHGGRMVDFAGWSMPVRYGAILDEHHAVRRRVGVFDVSHMGRLKISGDGAAALLDGLTTRRVDNLSAGRVRYSLMCNEAGGVLDDVLVYRYPDEQGEPYYYVVVNASNREKIVSWIESHIGDSPNVQLEDQTADTCMIAVQGPRAIELSKLLTDYEIGAMKYYSVNRIEVSGVESLVSRTGYTGEDGWELIAPADSAPELWERILAVGEDYDIRPCGLAARDTLRLEAAMPLYGHELTEQINPLEAGLDFAVSLKGRDFVGAEALRKVAAEGPARRRIGLSIDSRRAPREGYAVLHDGENVGEVTSGAFSPTLEKSIAMALVATSAADAEQLEVDLRGRPTTAQSAPLPFYQRGK